MYNICELATESFTLMQVEWRTQSPEWSSKQIQLHCSIRCQLIKGSQLLRPLISFMQILIPLVMNRAIASSTRAAC